MKPVLIICGPTAIGKTKLAAFLAKKFQGELISADSRQVYQEMDIVTGKDRPSGIKIHGLDLVKPDQEFSVAHFVNFATTLINQIINRGKLPILVGGTGQYLKSLISPPQTLAIPPDWALRRQLEKSSVLELQNRLKKLNLLKFKQLNHSDRLNPRRLIRALEVVQSASSGQNLKPHFNPLWIGLIAPKKILDKNIVIRVNQRIKAGAIQEWQKLIKKYPTNLPSMSGIGYRQLPDVKKWIIAEQQYARRQITYLTKIKEINWNPPDLVNLVKSWYTKSSLL